MQHYPTNQQLLPILMYTYWQCVNSKTEAPKKLSIQTEAEILAVERTVNSVQLCVFLAYVCLILLCQQCTQLSS